MKTLLAMLVLTIAVIILQPAAMAQETLSTSNIAVINMNAIRQNALVVKSIDQQIGIYRSAFQAEIRNEEDALRKANQELSRQRTLLSAEVFAEKRREFEQRVSKVQRLVQQRKGELDRIQGDSMRQVQVALNKIISEIAIEKGYILILRRNMTVLASNNLDITDRVLDTLNKSLASVKVAEPAK